MIKALKAVLLRVAYYHYIKQASGRAERGNEIRISGATKYKKMGPIGRGQLIVSIERI